MDCRSLARNIGLMCAAKLTGSSGPGRVTGGSLPVAAAGGVVSGGPAAVQSQAGRFASPDPPAWARPAARARAAGASHAKNAASAARNSASAGSPASPAAWLARLIQRACCSAVNSGAACGRAAGSRSAEG